MKRRGLRKFAVLASALLIIAAPPVSAQTTTDRALIVFTQILHDEDRSQKHVAFLTSYQQRSPWKFTTLVEVTQRLAIAGYDLKEVDEALEPCGDMASAIATKDDDEKFAAIVYLIFGLDPDSNAPPVGEILAQLETQGVPAYKFLAEATGVKITRIQTLASTNRLHGDAAKQLLLASFTRHYGGLAAKLAQKQRHDR